MALRPGEYYVTTCKSCGHECGTNDKTFTAEGPGGPRTYGDVVSDCCNAEIETSVEYDPPDVDNLRDIML